MLTGMDAYGAKGLLHMRRAGGISIAQDKEGCAVYGMPKVACEMGAVDRSAGPADIPRPVIEMLQRR